MFEQSLDPFRISSRSGSYEVIAQSEFELNDSVYIWDKRVPGAPQGRTFLLDAVEDKKSLEVVGEVLNFMAQQSMRRGDVVTVVGGGIAQDISTLACSLYMRGIAWRFIPSTTLAAMDSCVGGKASINFSGYKNLLGCFYPPTSIVLVPRLWESQTPSAKVAGIYEAIKIAYAHGDPALDHCLQLIEDVLESNSNTAWLRLAHASLQWKSYFIEVDEFDQAERQLLNFGHSFAHALEAASKHQIDHGTAVGLGMLAALKLSPASTRAAKLAKVTLLLLSGPSKPKSIVSVDWEAFTRALSLDKKNSAAEQRLVLSNISGMLAIVALPLNLATSQKLQMVMKEVLEDVWAR